MGWFDNIKTKFSSSDKLTHVKMMSGQIPVFSQFGNDIYESDIVQQCIDCIANEMSKLQISHVIKKGDNEYIAESKTNRLFEYGVNEYMTLSDFLWKITYLLSRKKNVFIYPKFSYYYNASGQITKREIDGYYPLEPKTEEFFQDATGRLFVKLYFPNGDTFTLPEDSLIHWRDRYSENEYLGGNRNGDDDSGDLLQTVQINDRLLQGVDFAVQKSFTIQGLMKFPMTVDRKTMQEDIKNFEEALNSSKSGIMGVDAKSEYIPLKMDPKLIDKDTLEFIENKILRHWGCSIPMLNGTATPAEHQAFYQRALEHRVISLSQAMTKGSFTPTQFGNGNRIKVYPEELIFMTTDQKLEFVRLIGDRGGLKNNKILSIFGIPPYEGGDVRYMSLNYVDVNIANQYQLNRAGANKGGEQNGNNKE